MAAIDKETEDRITGMLMNPETQREGFNLLVRHLSKPLYWNIRKMVLDHDHTDDILQNTFIKVWTHLDQFKGDSKLSTWIYRIAVNETYTFLNKERNEHQGDACDLEDLMVQNLKTDPYFSGDELSLKLQAAVMSLPDKQRQVFQMKYYDEMKYEEMSEILGTSVGALKASYHHAVKKIEAFITADVW